MKRYLAVLTLMLVTMILKLLKTMVLVGSLKKGMIVMVSVQLIQMAMEFVICMKSLDVLIRRTLDITLTLLMMTVLVQWVVVYSLQLVTTIQTQITRFLVLVTSLLVWVVLTRTLVTMTRVPLLMMAAVFYLKLDMTVMETVQLIQMVMEFVMNSRSTVVRIQTTQAITHSLQRMMVAVLLVVVRYHSLVTMTQQQITRLSRCVTSLAVRAVLMKQHVTMMRTLQSTMVLVNTQRSTTTVMATV